MLRPWFTTIPCRIATRRGRNRQVASAADRPGAKRKGAASPSADRPLLNSLQSAPPAALSHDGT